MQIHKERCPDLLVHAVTDSLAISGFQFSEDKLKSNFVTEHGLPRTPYHRAKQMRNSCLEAARVV